MKCHVNKPIIGRKSAGFTFCCFSHSDSLTFSTGYFSASIMWWKMFYIALWIQEAEGSAFGLSLFFIFLGVNFYVATSAFKNWNIRLLDIAHWQQEVVKFIFNLFGTSQLFCFVFKYIHAEGIRVWFWICCSSRYNLESIVADASHQAPWVNSYVYVGGIRLISIKYLYCWFKLEQLKYVTKETNKEWDEWVWKTMPVNYVVQSDIKHWSIRFIMYKRGEEAMIGSTGQSGLLCIRGEKRRWLGGIRQSDTKRVRIGFQLICCLQTIVTLFVVLVGFLPIDYGLNWWRCINCYIFCWKEMVIWHFSLAGLLSGALEWWYVNLKNPWSTNALYSQK